MRHTYFWVKIGWVPPYLAVFRHFSQNFANFENFYKCFTLFKGQKIFFFQKWPKYGLDDKWQMSSFFIFFLMKASLMDNTVLWQIVVLFGQILQHSVLFLVFTVFTSIMNFFLLFPFKSKCNVNSTPIKRWKAEIRSNILIGTSYH